jgi:DNA-binding XRE family transcriptional regulator
VAVKSTATLKGRTLPCKICGELYTDNIDPAADPARGGYIICARCTMKLAAAKPEEKNMSPDDFIKAIEDGLVKEFRKGLNVTQEAFSQKIGISRKILVNIERNLYIPSTKLQMKMYRKMKKYTNEC